MHKDGTCCWRMGRDRAILIQIPSPYTLPFYTQATLTYPTRSLLQTPAGNSVHSILTFAHYPLLRSATLSSFGVPLNVCQVAYICLKRATRDFTNLQWDALILEAG